MLFFRTTYVDEVAIGGPGVFNTTVTEEGVLYIACSIDGQQDWEPLTQEEYLAAGCIIPE